MIVVTAVAVAALSASLASAATLGGASSTGVGAGNVSISACDTDGFSVTYTTTAGNVSAVTVGDIADPGCEGAETYTTVTNNTGDKITSGGPQTVPTDADTSPNAVTVALSPQPVAEDVAGIQIVLAGP